MKYTIPFIFHNKENTISFWIPWNRVKEGKEQKEQNDA